MRARRPENAFSNKDHLIKFGFSIKALATNDLSNTKWTELAVIDTTVLKYVLT